MSHEPPRLDVFIFPDEFLRNEPGPPRLDMYRSLINVLIKKMIKEPPRLESYRFLIKLSRMS